MFSKFIKFLSRNLESLNFNFLKFVLSTFNYKSLHNKNNDGIFLFDHFEVPYNLVLRSIVVP